MAGMRMDRSSRLAIATALLLAPASSASAGGSSSSGDTGSTSDSSTSGTSAGSSDTIDPCDACFEPNPQTVTITEPADGAFVLGVFAVASQATDECYCDDCGCADEPVHFQRVYVDGVVQGEPCTTPVCEFEVSASSGPRQITIEAEYEYDFVSATISVTVLGMQDRGPTTSGDASGTATTDSADGTSDGGGEDEEVSGCGCRSDGDASLLALGILLALPSLRRRRRS